MKETTVHCDNMQGCNYKHLTSLLNYKNYYFIVIMHIFIMQLSVAWFKCSYNVMCNHKLYFFSL